MNFKNVKNTFFSIMIFFYVISIAHISYALNAHSLQSYNNYCNSGMIKSGTSDDETSDADNNLVLSFEPEALMFRKNGVMKIGEYNNKERIDPYSVSDDAELAVYSVYNDRIYTVIGKINRDDINYNFDGLSSKEKQRLKYELEFEALKIGYRAQPAMGCGKYNLRCEKNLVPFLKFVDRFYHAVDYRYGKTQAQINSSTAFPEGTIVSELEDLKRFHSKSVINSNTSEFSQVFKNSYNYKPCIINNQNIDSKSGESVFETLQDMFMSLVYLRPALKELKDYYTEEFNLNINDLTNKDRAAIISMVYDKFGDRVIANGDSDDNLTITMKVGDIFFPLIDYDISVAEKIYHTMIEIKYVNDPNARSTWVAEANKVLGNFSLFSEEELEKFNDAYDKAYAKYAGHRSPATAYDYNGEVLTPDDFESSHSFKDAQEKLAQFLRNKFSDSTFFKTANNAQMAARNYMIVQKMVDDKAFSDITAIYCSDVELVTHSYGYESNEIMLADLTRAELADAWGTDTDTDGDGLNDNVEADSEETINIRELVKMYCDYNNIQGEERERYLRDYSTTKVYSFKSSPVLIDTDFDGRNDIREENGRPFNNEYKITTKSLNHDIKVQFNMDYRYFFMTSTHYYADLSRMSAMLANAILKDNNTNKSFKVITDDNRTRNGVRDYMYWLGMEYYTYEDSDSDVPYAINCHDVVYLKSKPRSGEDSDDEYRGEEVVKNVIALVIGEKEEYKNELIENTGDDYLHGGFLEEANKIYDKFTSYAGARSGDKVYWITGYGTGGSIANIVADMLINSVGTEKVYCYTFGAYSTIDLRKIPEDEVVENTKNASIFNLKNIDDVTLSKFGDNAALYGREVAFSFVDDSKAKKEYNGIVNGATYDLNKRTLIDIFLSIFDPSRDINEIQLERNKKITSDIAAYIASTVKKSISMKLTMNEYFTNVTVNDMHIENPHDLNQKKEDTGLLDRRDGYPFNQVYFDPLSESDYENEENTEIIKLSDFTYSNYTFDNLLKERDINYVKFWNYGSNGKLSDYNAGDFSKKTKFTREDRNRTGE